MSQTLETDSTVLVIPEITGCCGAVRVTFLNTPFRFWHDTRKKTYAEQDFGCMLLNEIYHRQSFFVKTKGLFKKPCCRFCGASLDMSLLDIGMFAIELCPSGYGVCQIRIELPAAACGVCKTHNAVRSSRIERHIHNAIVNALGAEDSASVSLMAQCGPTH